VAKKKKLITVNRVDCDGEVVRHGRIYEIIPGVYRGRGVEEVILHLEESLADELEKAFDDWREKYKQECVRAMVDHIDFTQEEAETEIELVGPMDGWSSDDCTVEVCAPPRDWVEAIGYYLPSFPKLKKLLIQVAKNHA